MGRKREMNEGIKAHASLTLERIMFVIYRMEVCCVRERRATPNVKEREEVVVTKNNRGLLKVRCARCDITKARFPTQGGKRPLPLRMKDDN